MSRNEQTPFYDLKWTESGQPISNLTLIWESSIDGSDHKPSNANEFPYSGAPRAPVGRARREPWVRKNGNPSMREILVKASGMARGCVRLRPTYVAPDNIFT